MNIDKSKIAAVVVTYNRLELLKKCIDSIRRQTRKLDEIIIVNNSSTDGTIEWLNNQKNLTVITQENSGSAGGQYTGIKTAYEKGYDWIWCMDTDIIMNSDTLINLLQSDKINKLNTGFLSSAIYNPDGELAFINTPYLSKEIDQIKSFLEDSNSFPIISGSFGSVLFSRLAIKENGYPNKTMFIWGDDAEYTMRFIKNGFRGYLVRDSKAVHYAPTNLNDPFDKMNCNDIKFKYGLTNTLYLIRLRNIILYNSRSRGYGGAILFFFRLLKRRGRKGFFRDIVPIIMWSIQGMTAKL